MYFKNNELFKASQQNKMPTPSPRTTASSSSGGPTVSTLNKNCHEIINNDFDGYYKAATELNYTNASTAVNEYVDDEDDEVLENVNIDNDPHQRLIC